MQKNPNKPQNTNKTTTHKYHIICAFFYSKNIRDQEIESGESKILWGLILTQLNKY